jgi:hypothetical protein
MKASSLSHIVRFSAACLLAGLPSLSKAQDALPVQESVFTAGVTATGGGQTWAYILWQSNAPDLLEARTYSIWEKPGTPASGGFYTRRAVVGLQMDPLAISALIDRAVLALKEDETALDNTVTMLFEDLTTGSISLPDKVSAVLRGALAEPRFIDNLLLGARRHPALNMALGQAVALPIPPSGAVTFEIREHDPLRDADLGVIGRVTVNHASPIHLPPPTVLAVTPKNPRDGFNNLNIKFRWDTPPALRRVQLLTQGYNLYRVEKAYIDANHPTWPVSPPPASTLAALIDNFEAGVTRVNSGPITPSQLLDAVEALGADHTVSFFTDEETRFPGYPATHITPQSGDQYYYFVTVRDLLGRDLHSGTSPGVLGTFCDVMPPPMPTGLNVTNEFNYNAGTETQILRLHWKANSNAGPKKTTGYFIYRWSRADEVYQHGSDPSYKLVAGPIWPGPGQTSMSWDDPGPYNASTGLTYDNTVWYTIRSSDDGSLSPPGAVFCMDPPFGNLSGHSPPTPGVLRDRVGPARPNATIFTWCLRPRIVSDRYELRREDRIDRDYFTFHLTAHRPKYEPNIVAVDFRYVDREQVVELGRVQFAQGAESLHRVFRDLRPGSGKQGWTFYARAVSLQGEVSDWVENPVYEFPGVGELAEVRWKAFAEYERVPFVQVGSNRRECHTHVIPPREALEPGEEPWIEVGFLPPPGTKQYKLYYRIDKGPLTLAHEDSGNFDPVVALYVALKLLPATASEMCLFLQVFDINGNPSQMANLGCLQVQGTQPIAKPMLAPIGSGLNGIIPQAQITWFCPPQGVDRFRVWIAASPMPINAGLSPLLYDDESTPSPNLVSETVGSVVQEFDYASFNTELIGPLFGLGATFALDLNVMWGSKLRVKVAAVTASGQVGPWSNIEEFEWKPEEGPTGPDVPWPARPLPGYGTVSEFEPGLQSVYLASRQSAAVRIGQANGRHTVIRDNKEGQSFRLDLPHMIDAWLFKAKYANPSLERTVLPVVLYRTQIPDPANWTEVPGDIVQVSPLMETIAGEHVSGGYIIYDPFIHVEWSVLDQTKSDIFLLDTQPQIAGARYSYILVLFDPETKEIFKVIPAGSVNIP